MSAEQIYWNGTHCASEEEWLVDEAEYADLWDARCESCETQLCEYGDTMCPYESDEVGVTGWEPSAGGTACIEGPEAICIRKELGYE